MKLNKDSLKDIGIKVTQDVLGTAHFLFTMGAKASQELEARIITSDKRYSSPGSKAAIKLGRYIKTKDTQVRLRHMADSAYIKLSDKIQSI